MIKFSFILTLICFNIQIFPQGKIQVVDSLTNSPIEGVNIFVSQKTKSTVTNREGYFTLNVFTKEDTIILSHVSFSTKKFIVKDILNRKFVLLSPKVINQKEVNVIDKKVNQNENSFSETININNDIKASFVSVGDVLKNESSLFIKDYGGNSGVKLISSRGLNSESTLVLFNEARVNDLRTGIFDLSAIDIGSIDKIIFLKNSEDNSTYSSPGGILKIFSNQKFTKQKANIGIKLSTDNYRSSYFNYEDGNEKLFYTFSGDRSYSSNHYKYSFEGKELKRDNANFNKSFLSGAIGYSDEKINLNIYSHYSYLNSGIPGFVVTNNYSSSRAFNVSSSFLSILNNKWLINDDFSFQSILSFNKQNLSITDPDGILIFKGEAKESNLNDFTIQNKISYSSKISQLYLGHEYNYSNLSDITSFISADIAPGTINRHVNKLFTSAELKFVEPVTYLSSIKLFGKMNYEIINEIIFKDISSKTFSYNLGISLIPNTFSYINFKTHYSNEYRQPTFNERYYSSLFNHYDLQKEKYKTFDIGFDTQFELAGRTDFSASYFNINVKDKIIWVPTRLALQTPRNISDVKSQGLELSLTKKIFSDKLTFSSFYNYTDARNKSTISLNDNSSNKFLIYSPLHRLNFNTSVKVEPFTFSLHSTYSSKSFYTSDNDSRYILPQYFLLDFSANYKFDLFKLKHSIGITVYNILNRDYLIIQSYPMPLRSFLFTYNLELL